MTDLRKMGAASRQGCFKPIVLKNSLASCGQASDQNFACQSATNLDPLSASKNDPLERSGSWPDAV